RDAGERARPGSSRAAGARRGPAGEVGVHSGHRARDHRDPGDARAAAPGGLAVAVDGWGMGRRARWGRRGRGRGLRRRVRRLRRWRRLQRRRRRGEFLTMAKAIAAGVFATRLHAVRGGGGVGGGGGGGRGLRRRVRRLRRWRRLQRRRRRREFLTMAKAISADVFATRLHAVLGGRLVSLLLYGSAARGTHVPGRSDVNTLLICDAVDEPLFAALGPVLRDWQNPPPLILTEAEWRQSADAFPIGYDDIRAARHVLVGRDPWAGITVHRN